MKRYLVLALAALALCIAAPSAFAVRMIFDPTPSPNQAPVGNDPVCTSSTPCNIFQLNTPYQVTFESCTNPPLPSKPLQGQTGLTWCLWMNNVSGSPGNVFTFDITVPALSPPNPTLVCSASPPSLATASCPATLPNNGVKFTATFFAAPALSDNTDFYLLTDFPVTPGTATVTVSVPEPGELGLFGLGLLAVGVGVFWQRRRQTSRS